MLASSPVTLAGGTLEVSGTKTLTSIDTTGASTLSLADGAALTVGAITQSTGSLDVMSGTGASLVCLALAGTSPGWITVNGSAAEFESAGRLRRQNYAVTTTIAARGDTVLKLEAVEKPVVLALVFAAVPFGLGWLCAAKSVSTIFMAAVNYVAARCECRIREGAKE